MVVGKSPIAKALLECIFEGGCVSRIALLCMPYSYRNLSIQIKKLIDNQWIQQYDKGRQKRYRLLGKATDYLQSLDAVRFVGYESFGSQVKTNVRSMTLGDTQVLMKLSGFGVGEKEKPILPAITPYRPDGPDERSLLYHNYYQDEDDAYPHYETPINCFYGSTEIKNFAENRTDSGTGDVRYSRITGVLHTPDRIYRIYHTRNVAMDFRPTGEKNIQQLIPDLFTGYRPDSELGTLLLASSFQAAEKIIEQGLDPKRLKMARLHKGNQLRLNGSNLSHNLLYLPVRKESTPVLRFMSFPGWADWLTDYIKDSLLEGMSTDGAGFFLGDVEGYNLFSGLYMNLTHFSVILSNLNNSDRQNIAVLCFDWQREFYETILDRYTMPGNRYEIYELSSADFGQIVKTHKAYWRG